MQGLVLAPEGPLVLSDCPQLAFIAYMRHSCLYIDIYCMPEIQPVSLQEFHISVWFFHQLLIFHLLEGSVI